MTDYIFKFNGILNSNSLDDLLLKFKNRYRLNDGINHNNSYSIDREKVIKWFKKQYDKNFPFNPFFEYRNNNYGFRYIHDESTPEMLCFGCSVTYGIGVPYRYRWSEFLSRELNVTNYNFGLPGLSTSQIFLMFAGILRYIQPKFVVIALPEFSRGLLSYINKTDGNIEYFNGFSNYEYSWPKKKYKLQYEICKLYYSIPMCYHIDQFISTVQNMCVLAENKNIKLFLTSWEEQTFTILKNIDIENFKNCFLLKYIHKDTFGRDSIHPGIKYHYDLSQLMKEKILHES